MFLKKDVRRLFDWPVHKADADQAADVCQDKSNSYFT